MGIFDFLTPNDPMKQQSLLAAAAAMLQASGPSRTPTSFGQALAGGMGAYQQSQVEQAHRAMQQHAMEQSFKLNDLSIQDKESDLSNQAAQRKRAQDLLDFTTKFHTGGGAAPALPFPGGQSAASMMSGLAAGNPMPSPAAAPASQVLPATDRNSIAQQRLAFAQALRSAGYSKEADTEEDGAIKLQPKFSTDFRAAAGADGQLHNYLLSDDGSWKDTGLGVKPEMTEMDLGGSKQFIDKNSVKAGAMFRKSQSPDSIAVDRRAAADRAARVTGGAGTQGGTMDADTLEFQADRALRGDRTVFQGLGRGTQGAANLIALNQRIAQKAKAAGLTGGDLASINADYDGQKAALRTSGNISARVENAIAEADQLAPLAVAAGRDVARSGLMPFGKAQVMFDAQTNDPALKKFVTANNGLVSAYAGAMARGQKPTVNDYEHARHILSEAQSQQAYEATVAQMRLEMQAASAAPRNVREHLRGQISGSGAHGTTVPNPVSTPAATGGVKFLGFE